MDLRPMYPNEPCQPASVRGSPVILDNIVDVLACGVPNVSLDDRKCGGVKNLVQNGVTGVARHAAQRVQSKRAKDHGYRRRHAVNTLPLSA
eukprot:1973409-Amphidinium_carterae.1